MQKPSAKWIIIFNVVLCVPMAIIMSISAALLAKQPLVFSKLLPNMLIAFCLAVLVNIILPIPKIQDGFAKLFKLDPHSLPGVLVGSIPVCLIFTVCVGLPLSWWNVRMAPAFIFAFLDTFIPLYIILYIVAFIMTPIAMKAANNACK